METLKDKVQAVFSESPPIDVDEEEKIKLINGIQNVNIKKDYKTHISTIKFCLKMMKNSTNTEDYDTYYCLMEASLESLKYENLVLVGKDGSTTEPSAGVCMAVLEIKQTVNKELSTLVRPEKELEIDSELSLEEAHRFSLMENLKKNYDMSKHFIYNLPNVATT